MADIVLLDHQTAQVKRLIDSLNSCLGVATRTKTGGGKTYEALAVASMLELDVIWLGHATTLLEIEALCIKYGIKLAWSCSYQTVAGNAGTVMHDMLKRERAKKDEPLHRQFRVRKRLSNILKNGALVVFDELQLIGGCDLLRFVACQSIVRHIRNAAYRGEHMRSRVLLMSGSNFETVPFRSALGISYLLGLASYPKSDSRAAKVTKPYTRESIEELATSCCRLDREHELFAADRDLDADLAPKRITATVCRLYDEVIGAKLVFGAETFATTATRHLYNLELVVGAEHDAELQNYALSYRQLEIRAAFNRTTPDTVLKAPSGEYPTMIKEIGVLRAFMEMAIAPLLSKHVISVLEADQSWRVCVFTYSTNAAKTISNALYEYAPYLVTAETKLIKDRKSAIDAFNAREAEPLNNGKSRRVIVGTISALGIGTNLDDQYGGSERQVFVLAGTDLEHVVNRTHRATTKSNTSVGIVYMAQVPQYAELLEAVLVKQATTKRRPTRPVDEDCLPSRLETVSVSIGDRPLPIFTNAALEGLDGDGGHNTRSRSKRSKPDDSVSSSSGSSSLLGAKIKRIRNS